MEGLRILLPFCLRTGEDGSVIKHNDDRDSLSCRSVVVVKLGVGWG